MDSNVVVLHWSDLCSVLRSSGLKGQPWSGVAQGMHAGAVGGCRTQVVTNRLAGKERSWHAWHANTWE